MYNIIYMGNVKAFEDYLLYQAEQEMQKKGIPGNWCKVADIYARQLSIIMNNPYPEEDYNDIEDHNPPSIKHLSENVIYENLFRWGISGGVTGNHRIIFAIHNYSKVVLLHYFDKKYNGSIRYHDINVAEFEYDKYCITDRNLY